DKWYDSNNEQIQDQVIMYLTRCPTEEALPKLRQMILLRRTDLLAQVFRGFHFRSAAQMLQELAEQNFGNPTSTDIAGGYIMALAEMDPELVDIRRLASNNVFGSAYSRFYVKKLLLNAKERAKPILFELLKSPN